MGTLLDAIKAQREPEPTATDEKPLVVPEIEWRAFLATGACPWEETAAGEYRHMVTGARYVWGQPFVLPGDEA
jgi:hypothetical protein